MDELAPDLNKTLEALGTTLLSISKQMSDDKQENRREIIAVRQDVSDLREDFGNEISGIKDSQCLEPWQYAKVIQAAKDRVGCILREWCASNGGDMDLVCAKYFGKFVRLVHNDAKKAGLEIGKVVYTPKRNYTMLLEFIGKWYPMRGVDGQMKHYDKLGSGDKK